MTGIYPYLSLFLVNIVIDSLIYKKFDNLPKNVIFLLLLIYLTGILIDFLKSINDYKTKNIHKKFIYMISEKSMTIDYEEMEKGDFLQKLSDARYVIEHLGV